MNLLTIDFETFWSKEYSLSKLTTSEYINDPRFRVLGCGVKINDAPAVWLDERQVARFFTTYKDRIGRSLVLMHHAHFDGAIMQWKYGVAPLMYLDTLSMAHALHGPALGASLGKLAKYYNLGEKAPLSYDMTPEELKARGTIDCELTYKLFKLLGRDFPKDELKLIDLTVRLFTEPTFVANKEMLEKYIAELEDKKQEVLVEAGVDKSILMSNPQFADLLRSLGIDPPLKISPRTKKETYAFAKSDQGLLDLLEHDDFAVQAVVGARLGVKSTGDETRARRYLGMAQHGSLPVYLSYHAAHTGRWGGGDKTNFQNLRRGGVLRTALQAPQGHLLVVGDLAQIEARINFWLAEQENALTAFKQHRDIYCDFGANIYERKITKADIVERFVSKTGVLGLGFGCGADKFRTEVRIKGGIEIGNALAHKVVDKFRSTYYRVPILWEQMEDLLRGDSQLGPLESQGGLIWLPNGMALEYPELQRDGRRNWRYKNRNGWQKLWGGVITENCVQALARIILADMTLRLAKNFRIVTLTHDEIVLCVPEKEAERARQAVEFEMSYACGWYADLPVACEVGVGLRYGEAH